MSVIELPDDEIREFCEPGVKALDAAMALAAEKLIPNKPVDIPTWIKQNLEMVQADSDRSGQVVLSPIQAAIARIFQEEGTRRVSFLKPPRIGSSTLTAGVMLYYAVHLGEDTIFYERNNVEAQQFGDTKLYPLIAESQSVGEAIRKPKPGAPKDAWMDRQLVNGARLQLRGVLDDGAFRTIKGSFIALDEAGDPVYTTKRKGSEGNKLALAERRAQQFFAPVIYVQGTPTNPQCLVNEEFEASDKRVWIMKFPCCGAPQQFLSIVSQAGSAREKAGPGLKYRCDAAGEIIESEIGYECAECGTWLKETEKPDVIAAGAFVPTAKPKMPGWAGVYAWSIHSDDPQVTWLKICREHQLQVHRPDLRQPFKNLVLALPFEETDAAAAVDPHHLEARTQPYPAPVPDGVRVITWGMDSQEGSANDSERFPRHEIHFWGWGAGEECWSLGRFVVGRDVNTETGEITFCAPFSEEAQRQVWEILERPWAKADGTLLNPASGGVDIGWSTNEALAFVHHKRSKELRAYAVKGQGDVGKSPIIRGKPSRSRTGYEFQLVGSQTAMDTLYQRLRIAVPGPQFLHFPHSLRGTDFFDQLTVMVRTTDRGKTFWANPRKKSNEAVDCWVYAFAALRLIGSVNSRYKDAVSHRAVDYNVQTGQPQTYSGIDRSYGSEALAHEARTLGPTAELPVKKNERRLIAPDPQPAPPTGSLVAVMRPQMSRVGMNIFGRPLSSDDAARSNRNPIVVMKPRVRF